MPRKFFRKYLPDHESIRSRKLVAAFGGWLDHPGLWCLTRRSVAGAVAIGLFAGLVPGPLQMLCALLLAVPLRRNIPVALITTLYTNPLTIVPLYVIAYEYGKLLLGERHSPLSVKPFEMDWSDWWGSLEAMWQWALSLGKPLAIGLVALAMTLAVLGYLAVQVAWRLHVGHAWKARTRRRAPPR